VPCFSFGVLVFGDIYGGIASLLQDLDARLAGKRLAAGDDALGAVNDAAPRLILVEWRFGHGRSIGMFSPDMQEFRMTRCMGLCTTRT
jgi:hypothetical protein